jgi:transposase
MPSTRRRYSREFKIDAIKRIIEDGQPQQHVARDLGVSANTLAAWKREYLESREKAFPGNGRQKPDDAEVTRLRREVARLKRKVEILKKAAAYFARESR